MDAEKFWSTTEMNKFLYQQLKTMCEANGFVLSLRKRKHLVKIAEHRELLYDLGRFPDAKEHLEIWLDFLREREDLELLHYALMSVPCVNESRLREALLEVQEAFPFALEQIHVDDYKDKEAMERSFCRDAERKVYKGAGTVLKDYPFSPPVPSGDVGKCAG